MKKIFFFLFMNFIGISAFSQYIHKIKADSVLITNDSCNAELNLENSTRATKGFLYNYGNGRTKFVKSLTKIDSVTFIIGVDTLNLQGLGGGSNSWSLIGNSGTDTALNFLGTTDLKPLRFKTNNVLSGNLDSYNGHTALGYEALINNQGNGTDDGIQNTAIGHQALKQNTVGNRNTGIGTSALSNTKIGDNNIGLGANSNVLDSSLSNSMAIGTNAKIGISNGASYGDTATNMLHGFGTAFPTHRLDVRGTIKIVSPTKLTPFLVVDSSNGLRVLEMRAYHSSTENSTSIYIGDSSGASGQLNSWAYAAINNTALGGLALARNTFGFSNTSIGQKTLYNNISGNFNTAIGQNSMFSFTSGEDNTAVGQASLYSLTSGSKNLALGSNALEGNFTGSFNTSVGVGSGAAATGSYNTFIGKSAGAGNNGSSNVFIGHAAGQNSSGSNKLYIDISTTSSPLVYGEFDTNFFKINGTAQITDTLTITTLGSGDSSNRAASTKWVKLQNASAETLSNKRITARVGTTASSSTPTPDGDSHDQYNVTALAANATFGAPTGTPVNGQLLLMRIKDNGTARTLSWNSIYRASTDFALPSTTVLSKTMYLQFIYNSADSKWDCIGYTNGF